jgi:hypothetical protein
MSYFLIVYRYHSQDRLRAYLVDFVDGCFDFVVQSGFQPPKIFSAGDQRQSPVIFRQFRHDASFHFCDFVSDILSWINKLLAVLSELNEILCDVLSLLVDHRSQSLLYSIIVR